MRHEKNPLGNFVKRNAASGHPIPLKSTGYSIEVRSGLAVARQVRTFRNDEKRPIEATITFPVPFEAAVFDIQAKVGDRILKGSAKAKEAARKTYEDAIDAGKPAVLHEELLRGLHMLSVANVAPGAEIEVTATFAIPVALNAGNGTFRIPVTVGQIYGQSPLIESDDILVGGPVEKAGVSVVADQGTVLVNGGALDGGKVSVTLDRPIEVSVVGLYKDSPAALEGLAADGRKVSMSFLPSKAGEQPLDIVALLDVSGSMNERVQSNPEGNATKWDAVKSGIASASGAILKRGDAVEVWTFSNSCIRHGRVAGDKAGSFVGSIPFISGGTELPGAVAAVTQARREANVLLVTDGKSWNKIDVQAAVASGARFTVVLVGEDSLETNVGYLAAMSGGQMFVAAGADVHHAMSEAIASMRKVGNPVVPVKGKLQSVSRAVAGTGTEIKWSKAGETAAERAGEAHAVAAYAAHLAIQGMDAADAAVLAEAEGLVSHLTSIVMVDEAAEAVEGVPATRKVPLASPATGAMMYAAALAPSGGTALRSMAATHSVGKGRRGAMLYASGLDATGFHESVQLGSGGPDTAAVGEWIEKASVGDFWGDRTSIGDFQLPGLSVPRQPYLPDSLLVAGDQPAVVGNVKLMAGTLDWDAVPGELAKGDLQGVPSWIAAGLIVVSAIAEVAELARSLGIDAKAVAVALLAEADSSSSRTAGRIARAVLAKADKALADKARRAAGL